MPTGIAGRRPGAPGISDPRGALGVSEILLPVHLRLPYLLQALAETRHRHYLAEVTTLDGATPEGGWGALPHGWRATDPALVVMQTTEQLLDPAGDLVADVRLPRHLVHLPSGRHAPWSPKLEAAAPAAGVPCRPDGRAHNGSDLPGRLWQQLERRQPTLRRQMLVELLCDHQARTSPEAFEELVTELPDDLLAPGTLAAQLTTPERTQRLEIVRLLPVLVAERRRRDRLRPPRGRGAARPHTPPPGVSRGG